MAVLSNVEIQQARATGDFFISGANDGAPGSEVYDECSMNLRLSKTLRIPKEMGVSFDLRDREKVEETLRNAYFEVQMPKNGHSLEPGDFVLATTLEKIRLPIASANSRQLAGRIEGRSRFARFGLLVHFTAPTIHPGFGIETERGSPITLELKNLGQHSVMLYPELSVCQLLLERVDGAVVSSKGLFDSQVSATG